MEQLFALALGIMAPIYLEKVEFENDELHIYLDFYKGSKFACSICGAEGCGVHDTINKTWRHLNFFQYRCFLHFPVPRIKCAKCGVRHFQPEWTRPESGFTALFEAFIIMLAKSGMPYSKISEIVGENDKKLRRIVDHHVEKGYKNKDMSEVSEIGIDETSSKRGHNYVTVVTDTESKEVIFVTEGKDNTAIERFVQELHKHNGNKENITETTQDLSDAFIKGVTENLPNAQITFDRFHVMKLLNEAVDEIRRNEQKFNPLLKKTRYSWLKNRQNLTAEQLKKLESLEHENLQTAEAYRLKCTFQDIYANAKSTEEAKILLESWTNLAWNSNLAPIQRFVNTINNHWYGVIRYWTSRLTSGICEGINSTIQEIKRVARGYRNMRNFINTIYLRTCKVKLPEYPSTHSI
jgi:transposase